MPVSEKYDYALTLASECLDAYEKTDNEKAMSLSPVYKENNLTKTVLLQTILMQYYFGIEIEDGDIMDFFDACGRGQIMNCLERFKSDPALKDRVFDILFDFKELKGMVNAEIYQEKLRRNDPINRLLENIAHVSSPENLREKNEEMRKLIEDIDNLRANGGKGVPATGTAEEE
jgi:hypothetical protein